jgi:CTP:molybdopterin cytidylyltransferase MocA
MAGIILAAGASSRMGAPKALLNYRGETFVGRLIRVMSAACDPVIVALGHHATAIRAASKGAQFAVNPDPSRGQLSSLQCALDLLPEHAEGFLFQPVDCPAVDGETVKRIAEAALDHPLVIPRCDGERGHPVGVRRELIAEFLALPAAASTKEIIRRHTARTFYLDVEDRGVLDDVDDREAYRLLQEHAQ